MKLYGFNAVPNEFGSDNGVYVNLEDITAMEGFRDKGTNCSTTIHMRSGLKLEVLGDPFYLLKQIQADITKGVTN